ncbi:MAG: DUF922 domain-containing protein [Desulfuromonadaceae bacterium]
MLLPGRFRSLFVMLFFCAAAVLADEGNASVIQTAKSSDADNPLLKYKTGEASRNLRIDEKYNFYDIKGSSIAELKQQMKRGGTKWNDGKVYAALTTWDIQYDYEIIEKNGRYSIKSVATDISVVYILPNRVTAATDAPDLHAGEWGKFMDHLKEHEYGHKDISVKTAAEINEALASMGSTSSKADLDKAAKLLVEAKFKQLKKLQIAYDEETQHGITQGAILAESHPVQAFLLPK